MTLKVVGDLYEHRAFHRGCDGRESTVMESPPSRFPQPDDEFQLRITLLEVEPPVWRRVVVSQDVPLPRLHSIIQAALGWQNAHLHQFRVGQLSFGEPTLEYGPGPIDHRQITLHQILPRAGATCIYEYDFGDGWEHEVQLEKELPADPAAGHTPRCTAGERACPPEDCGGPHGYLALIAAIQNPGHPEHAEYRDWLGGAFDPEAFDLQAANARLARLTGKTSRARRS